MELTHQSMTELAVKWLKRPGSRNGHGCHVALSEVAGGWCGEIPDAIGFRAAGDCDGTVVVEVKRSRADFLADAKKPHRSGEALGMGNWRYYLCPEGLIKPEELPEKWGLIYANTRGHLKPQAGPVAYKNYRERAQALQDYRFDSDTGREQFILVKMINRVGDPEELNQKLRSLWRGRSRLEGELATAKSKLREKDSRLYSAKGLLRLLSEEHPELVAEHQEILERVGL